MKGWLNSRMIDPALPRCGSDFMALRVVIGSYILGCDFRAPHVDLFIRRNSRLVRAPKTMP